MRICIGGAVYREGLHPEGCPTSGGGVYLQGKGLVRPLLELEKQMVRILLECLPVLPVFHMRGLIQVILLLNQ